MAPSGTFVPFPVVAVISGEIIRLEPRNPGSGGVIEIHSSDCPQVVVQYVHLNAESVKDFTVGQHIHLGEPLGIADGSGTLSGGPHLHLKVFISQVPVDPMQYMERSVPSVETSLEREVETTEKTAGISSRDWTPALIVLGTVFILLVWIGPMHFAGAGLAVHAGSFLVKRGLFALIWGVRGSTRSAWRFGCFWGLMTVICWWGVILVNGLNGLKFPERLNQPLPPPEMLQVIPIKPLETSGAIAPFFHPQVLRWEDEIVRWGKEFDLNPNLIATVMQIESCGWQDVRSGAGAMGLFQVMPFHFEGGENGYDPDTNARRGLLYLRRTLTAYPDDVQHALAAYNGGIAGTSGPQSSWPRESLKYYDWGHMYLEAEAGSDSPTFQKWLAAGGASLCAGRVGH